MTVRRDLIAEFLTGSGWDGASRSPLAGDASTRRYERLTLGARRAVLMEAPSENGESTRAFARMAQWLGQRGYSAPVLFAADHEAGFLLLEDLGDGLVAKLVTADPTQENMLYTAATDFLSDLHRHPAPGFVHPLDGPALAALVEMTPRWYLAGIGAEANQSARALPGLIETLYTRLTNDLPVPSLRDFHAENLIWLPERRGLARLGLLDFQDAVSAHPAYDLVSLLQDARRDVPAATEAAMIEHYLAGASREPDRFRAIYALLGAQRALRILGVFARLTLHFGKPQYLKSVPRVWTYLNRNLAHPALSELATAVHEGLPEPTPERIERIRAQCGQYPTP